MINKTLNQHLIRSDDAENLDQHFAWLLLRKLRNVLNNQALISILLLKMQKTIPFLSSQYFSFHLLYNAYKRFLSDCVKSIIIVFEKIFISAA